MRRRNWLFTVSALFAVLALPTSVLGASGDRDTSFNQDGMATIFPFGPHGTTSARAVVAAGGKVVVAGDGYGESGSSRIIVARFGPNGYKDGTCGGGIGFKILDFGHNSDRVMNGLAVLPDGKILVAATWLDFSFGHQKLMLVRLQSNCELDDTFGGGDGVFISDFGFVGGATGNDLLVLPNGNIIVSGSVRDGSFEDDIGIWRFTPNGALDPTFGGGDGMTVLSAGPQSESADRVIRLSSGKLVVAGRFEAFGGGSRKTMLAGFNADGSVDKSFGNLGSVTYDSTSSNVDDATGLTTSLGKIIVCIRGSNDAVVLRLNPNGWPDGTWGGGDGQVRRNYDGDVVNIFDCKAQADGKIVLAGSLFNEAAVVWIVARLTVDGDKDLSFGGSDGFSSAAFLGQAFGVGLDSSGRILTAGFGDGTFAVARFLP